MTQAEQYARWVLDPENSTRTGRLIKLAAERFLSDLKREDIYFDEDEAVKACNFMERYCYQWEGDWRGQLIVLEPWQKFAFQQLFGWLIKGTGRRRFTKLYLQISKKNGKSTMCAGLALFHLFADDRIQTPKVFTAANNEDQAKICVNMAGRIVEQSPDLSVFIGDEVKLSTYGVNITEVIHKEKDGFIKALSKEGGDKTAKTSGGKHGINASLGLVDEFGMSPDHGASGTISTSMAARLERLMAYLTTAGFNQDGPCFSELRSSGIDVLEGTITMDNYLPLIFEIDEPLGEDGQPKEITIEWLLDNPDLWYQSNPNMGVSVYKDYLVEQLQEAAKYKGTTAVDVKTLNFNIWCNKPSIWIPKETWDLNSHGIPRETLKYKTCYGGLEIISGLTMNAFSLYFPQISGEIDAVRCMFWMPSDAIKSKNMPNSIESWVDDGLIEVCAGNVIDNDFIFNKIMELCKEYNLHSVAHPITLTNNDILQALVRAGVECNPISTGYKAQSTPSKQWEEMLNAKRIEHFNNPVITWMNSHTSANKNKDGDIRVEKADFRTVGITASINALAQYKTIMANNQDDGKIESWA